MLMINVCLHVTLKGDIEDTSIICVLLVSDVGNEFHNLIVRGT